MKKQFIYVCLIFTLLLMGCGGNSSSGGSDDSISPLIDLTGEYEMEINSPDISCSEDIDFSICVECRKIADEIYNKYNESNVTINQYGDNFDFIINDELYTGIISSSNGEYTFSDKEFITQDGITIKIEWDVVFNPLTISIDEYGFSGYFDYNVWYKDEILCGFSIRFEAYLKGSRDPIIYINPIKYDYGIVEYGQKKTMEFTVYNANSDSISKDLMITAKDGLDELVNDPDYIFHTDPSFILDDDILVRYDQPFTFSIVYEPKNLSLGDSYILTLITNDPDYPEINIELKGKGK